MSGAIDFLNGWAEVWWPQVFHGAWQAGAVVFLALVLVKVMGRRFTATLCYALLFLALLKFAVPPLLGLPTGLFSAAPAPPSPDLTAVDEVIRPPLPDAPAVEPEFALTRVIVESPDTPPPTELSLSRPSEEELYQAYFRPPMETLRLEGDVDPGMEATYVIGQLRPTRTVTPTDHRLGILGWLMGLHLTGMAVIACWILASTVALLHRAKHAEPAATQVAETAMQDLCTQLGTRRRIRLLVGGEDDAPIAFGLIRPTVLLTRGIADQMDTPEARAILAHELAHHRRRDPWVIALENLTLMVWWFHPFAWALVSRLRKTREECCDDMVLSLGVSDGGTYCEGLLRTAIAVSGPRRFAMPLGHANALHPLGPRMKRIMDTTLRRRARLSLAGLLLVVAMGLVILPGLRVADAHSGFPIVRDPETSAKVEHKLQDGLVARYALDGDATDQSGHGNHGKTIDTGRAMDRHGRASHALAFNGETSAVTFEKSDTLDIHGNVALSVAAWIKPGELPRGLQPIITKYGSLYGHQFALSIDEQAVAFRLSPEIAAVGGRLSAGAWHMLAGVYDPENDRLSVFVDGQRVGETAVGYTSQGIGGQICLGRDESGERHYAGLLDDVIISTRAWPDDEVLRLYQDGAADLDPPAPSQRGQGTDRVFEVGGEDTTQPLRVRETFTRSSALQSWELVTSGEPPGTVEVEDGALHVVRKGASISGGKAGFGTTSIGLHGDWPVTDVTSVRFDAKPVFREWAPEERERNEVASITLLVTDSAGKEIILRYGLDYEEPPYTQHRSYYRQRGETGRRNEWSRNVGFNVREFCPEAERLRAVSVGSHGFNYEAWFDNIVVAEGEEPSKPSGQEDATVAPDIASGLVAYYPLDGDLLDRSGNENHGIALEGGSFAEAVVGKGLRCAGCQMHAAMPRVPEAILGDAVKFVGLWFWPDDTEPQGLIYLGPIDPREDRPGRSFRLQTGRGLHVGLDVSFGVAYSSITLKPRAWNYVYAYWDGEQYVVGVVHEGTDRQEVLGGGRNRLPRNSLHAGRFWIGQVALGQPHCGRGVFDDVRAYNRVLTTEELGQIYEAGVPTAQSPTAVKRADTSARADRISEVVNHAFERFTQAAPYFAATYRHRSRDRDIEEPGTLELYRLNADRAALVKLPFMESEYAAVGEDGFVRDYLMRRSGDRAFHGMVRAHEGGKAFDYLLAATGREGKEVEAKFPTPVVFDPNQRPDPYAAACVLLRAVPLEEGASHTFDAIDVDNNGDDFVSYRVKIECVGREEVTVPAGTFNAHHLVQTQLTSANTWFKKRAGHVTEYWVMDDYIPVRILRHREPYEVLLQEILSTEDADPTDVDETPEEPVTPVSFPEAEPTLEITFVPEEDRQGEVEWTDMLVWVQEGDVLFIQAAGRMGFHKGHAENVMGGPNGQGLHPVYQKYFLLSDLAFMSLVGMVGLDPIVSDDERDGMYGPGFIGAGIRSTKRTPGADLLRLGVNDSTGQNVGAYRVRIWLLRDGAVLSRTEASKSALPEPDPDAPALEILEADYGRGNRWSDATEKLRASISEGGLSMPVTDALGESPWPNMNDALHVRYRIHGVTHTAIFHEGGVVTLGDVPTYDETGSSGSASIAVAPEPTTTVSGRVTNRAGEPVANARLRIMRWQSGPQHNAETTTGEDGRFMLPAEPSNSRLFVHADGYASMYRTADVARGNNMGWDFVLPESAHVSGRVVDTKGNPAPNRVLELWTVGDAPPPAPGVSYYASGGEGANRSDSNGNFDLPNMAPGTHRVTTYRESAFGGDRGMQQVPVKGGLISAKPGEVIEGFDIVVNPPEDFVIGGKISYATGEPIPGITVDSFIPHGRHWWTKTDDEGAFYLDGLDGIGQSKLRVHVNGVAGAGSYKLAMNDVPLNTTDINLVIPRNGSIAGMVRNAKTGEPIAASEITVPLVELSRPGTVWPEPQVRVSTEADGSFRIEEVPAAHATVQIRAEGLGAQRFEVDVAAGETVHLDATMRGPSVITGTCYMDGQPKSTGIIINGEWLRSNDDGTYRYDQFPNGEYTIWFFEYDGWYRYVPVTLKAGETTRLDVEMGGVCEITGTVDYPSDQRLCTVRLSPVYAPDGWYEFGRPLVEDFAIAYTHVREPGASYTIRGVPPGKYYVMVGKYVSPMHRSLLADAVLVEAKAGENLTVNFDLTQPRTPAPPPNEAQADAIMKKYLDHVVLETSSGVR